MVKKFDDLGVLRKAVWNYMVATESDTTEMSRLVGVSIPTMARFLDEKSKPKFVTIAKIVNYLRSTNSVSELDGDFFA